MSYIPKPKKLKPKYKYLRRDSLSYIFGGKEEFYVFRHVNNEYSSNAEYWLPVNKFWGTKCT